MLPQEYREHYAVAVELRRDDDGPYVVGAFGNAATARGVLGELALGRRPELSLERREPQRVTVRVAAERWLASRVDVAEGTRATYRVNLERVLPRIGDVALDELDVARVTELVSELSELKRESLRRRSQRSRRCSTTPSSCRTRFALRS